MCAARGPNPLSLMGLQESLTQIEQSMLLWRLMMVWPTLAQLSLQRDFHQNPRIIRVSLIFSRLLVKLTITHPCKFRTGILHRAPQKIENTANISTMVANKAPHNIFRYVPRAMAPSLDLSKYGLYWRWPSLGIEALFNEEIEVLASEALAMG